MNCDKCGKNLGWGKGKGIVVRETSGARNLCINCYTEFRKECNRRKQCVDCSHYGENGFCTKLNSGLSPSISVDSPNLEEYFFHAEECADYTAREEVRARLEESLVAKLYAIWDMIEERRNRGVRKPSIKAVFWGESGWFGECYDFATRIARYNGRSLTRELWEKLYSFSFNFIKQDSADEEKLRRARNHVAEFEWSTARPFVTMKEGSEEKSHQCDWLVNIRIDKIRKDFPERIDFLDQYVKIIVMEVVKIYGWETSDRSLYELHDTDFVKETCTQVDKNVLYALLLNKELTIEESRDYLKSGEENQNKNQKVK